ncbi:MAG: cupin domain-containing protein [Actinomycetota bacterium]|nr:cupin domain-containing protein [Actinomycetota bacterium]
MLTPFIDRPLVLHMQADGGMVNLTRVCGWLGQELTDRSAEGTRTGPTSRIGVVDSGPTPGLDYVRHRNADEIQYQVTGRRLLVTQHGAVEVGPGDFVRIPIGLAFTSISAEPFRYISTISFHRLPRVYEASRTSDLGMQRGWKR